MELPTKPAWQEYIRNGINYRVITPILDGITNRIKKYWGTPFQNIMAYCQGESFYWYNDVHENRKIGREIINKFAAGTEMKSHITTIWRDTISTIKEKSDSIVQADLSQWSLDELIDIYTNLVDLTAEQYGFSIAIDAVDEIGAVVIEKKIKDTCAKTGQKFETVYNAITMPVIASVALMRERSILSIARYVRSGGKELNDLMVQKKIKAIADEYWWMDLGWATLEIDSEKQIETMLEQMLDEGFNLEKRAEELKDASDQIQQTKQQLIKELKLDQDEEFTKYLQVTEDFTIFHDWRKEFQMRELFSESLLLKEVGERLEIEPDLFNWMSPSEIVGLKNSKDINEEAIRHRADRFLIVIKGGESKEFLADEATKVWLEEREEVQREYRDLQGTPACLGKATGEVFIALTANEITDIKPGQVLVTGMTTPDYVPAMKKAAAIVTDEGGITCHAAIISRELGIPCIVGTRDATRVFENGQIVEVDANHGVVRAVV